MKLVVVLCLIHFGIQVTALTCGRPGKPENGDLSPLKDSYDEDAQVTYTCNDGYYFKRGDNFVQQENRSCQCNRTWSGTVPECNYLDYAYNTTLNVTGIDKPFMFDGNDTTCGAISYNNTDSDLSENRDILINLHNFTHSMAYIRIRLGNKSVVFQPVSESSSCQLNYGENLSELNLGKRTTFQSAIFLFPKELLLNEQQLHICSLSIFATAEATCGSPDEPLYGTFTNNDTTTGYSCTEGYKLHGDRKASCSNETHETRYRWLPQSPPRCLRDGETDPVDTCQRNKVLAYLKKTEYIVPIGIAILLIICAVLYCLGRCCLKRRKTPQADDTEAVSGSVGSRAGQSLVGSDGDEIYEIVNLTKAKDADGSNNAREQQFNRNSPLDDVDVIYDQIPSPSTKSNEVAVEHFSKNGEEYARVMISSQGKLKTASGRINSGNSDPYASIKSTKSAQTSSSGAKPNYSKNGDVYAQVTKSNKKQSKADNGRNNPQELEDAYAMVNDAGYATANIKKTDNTKNSLLVKHYVENGEEYAQVTKTSKAKNDKASASKSAKDPNVSVQNTRKDSEVEATYAQVDKSAKKRKTSNEPDMSENSSIKSTTNKDSSASDTEVFYAAVKKNNKSD